MLARTSVAARVCRQCQRFATTSASSRPTLVRLPYTPPSRSRFVTTDAFADAFPKEEKVAHRSGSDAPTAWVGPDGAPLDDIEHAANLSDHDAPIAWVGPDGAPYDDTADDFPVEEPSLEGVEEGVPWYLQIEEPLTVAPARPDPLPQVPDDAPPILPKLLEYVYHEMGLDYLSLLDLRALETSTALGPNLIMILGTARSERHVQVVGSRLTRWLRRDHRIPAMAAGLISPAEVKIKLRRLRKRAQVVGGSAGAAFEGKAHGLSTGWVVVNLGTLGENKGEQAKLDEFGRISGFGRVVEGCTIVVQCLTEKRREQLDLEGLWKGNLAKHQRLLGRLEQGPQGQHGEEGRSHEGVRHAHSNGGRFPVPSGSSRGALTPQFRSYSTNTANTLPSDASPPLDSSSEPSPPPEPSQHPVPPPPSDPATVALAARTQHVLTTPTAVSRQELITLFRYLLTNTNKPIAENINTAEALLQAMTERGHRILDNDLLIPLIATIAHVTALPDYNAPQAARPRALLRMQTNFEVLLTTGVLPCPTEPQLCMLLTAYAAQKNWERFWKTLKFPMRWGKPRSERFFTHMLHAAATSEHAGVCLRAVRMTLPYMDLEQGDSPALLDRPFCLGLLKCIAVADPISFLQVEEAWRELGFDVPCQAASRGAAGVSVSDLKETVVALAKLRERWRSGGA